MVYYLARRHQLASKPSAKLRPLPNNSRSVESKITEERQVHMSRDGPRELALGSRNEQRRVYGAADEPINRDQKMNKEANLHRHALVVGIRQQQERQHAKTEGSYEPSVNISERDVSLNTGNHQHIGVERSIASINNSIENSLISHQPVNIAELNPGIRVSNLNIPSDLNQPASNRSSVRQTERSTPRQPLRPQICVSPEPHQVKNPLDSKRPALFNPRSDHPHPQSGHHPSLSNRYSRLPQLVPALAPLRHLHNLHHSPNA